MTDLHQLKRTPFHPRTSVLCLPQNWRRWAGCIAAGSYDLGLEREYWAIRNQRRTHRRVAADEVPDRGPDAARLLDRVTPRNIAKLAVGQVYYTGWCDDDGQAAGRRHHHAPRRAQFFASPRPSRRCGWLSMNAVGMDVTITEHTGPGGGRFRCRAPSRARS